MKPAEVLALIKENEVKFVDFRFSDTTLRFRRTRSTKIFLRKAKCLTARQSRAGKALTSRT